MENGREKTMAVPMTFADFAITEGRFRKHFRKVPRDAWNENMIAGLTSSKWMKTSGRANSHTSGR
jgi:hypothetical protein